MGHVGGGDESGGDPAGERADDDDPEDQPLPAGESGLHPSPIERLGTGFWSEPDAGSDLAAIRSRGELSADGIKVHKLAVFELPRSGKPEELLAKYGLDAAAIVKKVKALV